MLILKELSGLVSFVQPDGTVIKQLGEVVTMSANPQRSGIYVCDAEGREFFISLKQVLETQILPAAAIAFSGSLSDLWTLLVNGFFTELHSTNAGANITNIGNWIWVKDLDSLPAPVTGVITLEPEKTYVIVGDVDLLGNRLVTSGDTTIIGGSSETSSLTSTGLSVLLPLITSEWTLAMRHIDIKDVGYGVKVDGNFNPPVALDWTGVNFTNVPTSIDINTCANFIFSKGALLNSTGINFTGTIGTIGVDNSLFVGTGAAANIFNIAAGATITRRFRIIYSSIVAFGATVGINVDIAATVPTEAYILDTVNFSGGGTYLNGVMQTSNKALFLNCVPIVNTSVNGQIYMKANAVATVVAAANTWYKVAGVTTPSPDNSKYTTLVTNRLTNDAVIQRKYLIQCNLSFTAGANNVCEFGFYDSKLGAIRTPSITPATANAGGRAENVSFACVVQHSQGDYLEIWTQNTSAVQDITVTDENFIVTEIK